MKRYNCPNCGAAIKSSICEYCGTVLKKGKANNDKPEENPKKSLAKRIWNTFWEVVGATLLVSIFVLPLIYALDCGGCLWYYKIKQDVEVCTTYCDDGRYKIRTSIDRWGLSVYWESVNCKENQIDSTLVAEKKKAKKYIKVLKKY